MHQTRMAWYAARVCRSTKTHEELLSEVINTPMETLQRKLWAAVQEEWAVDLLRHSLFTVEVRDAPPWFFKELWRHQFVVRNVAPEELSQRAIASHRLAVHNPFLGDDYTECQQLIQAVNSFMQRMAEKGYSRDDVRNMAPQGVLTNAVLSMNAETVHHLVAMRGQGTHAAPLFQAFATELWDKCAERCPWLFRELLKK